MVLLAGKMDVSLTWRTFSNQQALDRAVENGEVDISPGMLQTPASLHHWLFSQPYLRVPHKIVGFPDGSGNAVDLDRLSLSERLALDANSDALRFVRRNYPELPRVEAASDRAALQTVQQQYAEYAIVDEAQLATLLKEPEFSRLAVVGDLGYTHLLRIAVRRDWPELPPVLDRQLQDIPGIRMEQLYARWMLPSYPRLIDSLSFWHRMTLACCWPPCCWPACSAISAGNAAGQKNACWPHGWSWKRATWRKNPAPHPVFHRQQHRGHPVGELGWPHPVRQPRGGKHAGLSDRAIAQPVPARVATLAGQQQLAGPVEPAAQQQGPEQL
jgi:ABC-type amino acid transport substrate-binding protein